MNSKRLCLSLSPRSPLLCLIGAGDSRRSEPLHRYGLHPGSPTLAGDRQGPRTAGHAKYFQLTAASFRTRLRLYHAGGSDPGWRCFGARWHYQQFFCRGPKEHIYLILLIIPFIAPVIDRLLYWIQYELFPYRYGSSGHLARLFRGLMRVWESATGWWWRSVLANATVPAAAPGSTGQCSAIFWN